MSYRWLRRGLPALTSCGLLVVLCAPAPAVAAPSAAWTGSTLFGTTVQLDPGERWGTAIARIESTEHAPLGVVRIFQQEPRPAALLPVSWRSGIFSFDLPPDQVLSGEYDQQFRDFFAAAPRDHRTWWSYFHEADVAYQQGRITDLAQFRAASNHVAQLARDENNPVLQNAVVLVGWTANPWSGKDVSDFLPRSDLFDLIAFDNYNDGFVRQGVYGDPTHMIELDVAAAASVGKPFAVAEFGSVVIDGDTEGRAAYITRFCQVAEANDARFVAYYDSDRYGTGNDFRLLDGPSQRAFAAFLNG